MDIVVLSHLRWDFVFQRPQHLMGRAARRHRVLFVEEPMVGDSFGLERCEVSATLTVARPTIPEGTSSADADGFVAGALREAVEGWRRGELVVWHYSVMAERLSRELGADVTVFDCMDELSAFHGAPADIVDRERDLLARADLVFTGGHSLWEAKRALHASVHLFPSCVDVQHFAAARNEQPQPAALDGIPHPRLVYAGVIDERLDLGLLARLASAGAGELVLIGPVAKIDPADLPDGPRIHRLGMQPYDLLPALFAHCDLALMPFALNAATRFLSPTKTPEYLAAGLPVVTTAITDVVRGYGDLDMVRIAGDADAFVAACSDALSRPRHLAEVDERIASMSWDTTWEAMERLVQAVLGQPRAA
ncbi:MAG: glycosyltransferase [Chloroflexota bacterium]|nr:glycosyltransferase [Chloroflexota bacterium]